MLFNSLVFWGFFAIVFPLYWAVRRHLQVQNGVLLAASCVFYAYWDVWLLGPLVFSVGIDYLVALQLDKETDTRRRKQWLLLSLVSNLGLLSYFKYYNFFASSFQELCAMLGFEVGTLTLEIVLPVAISFYTFQSLSYTIDVYRKKVPACRNLLYFSTYVMFFPQLVAGPIERASHFMPQIQKLRQFDWGQFHVGVHLIFWGLVKKMVISDNLALIANPIFENYKDHSGGTLLVAVFAFTFQIYCDFSGYTDIARGLGKMLGFDILLNFKLPYFAVNPSDFWERWHISLSSWLRDYLYISLGGNRGGNWATYRNLMLTMLLGGLWHGASWNFIYWGLYHGIILVLFRLFEPKPLHQHRATAHWGRIVGQTVFMFFLTMFGWLLFRCRTHDQIVHFVDKIGINFSPEALSMLLSCLAFIAPLLVVQSIQFARNDLAALTRLPAWALAILYATGLAAILLLGPREPVEFIYFQF